MKIFCHNRIQKKQKKKKRKYENQLKFSHIEKYIYGSNCLIRSKTEIVLKIVALN